MTGPKTGAGQLEGSIKVTQANLHGRHICGWNSLVVDFRIRPFG